MPPKSPHESCVEHTGLVAEIRNLRAVVGKMDRTVERRTTAMIAVLTTQIAALAGAVITIVVSL